jgi:hypothetical protein
VYDWFQLTAEFHRRSESLVRKAQIHFDSPFRTRSEVDPASFLPSTSTAMAKKTFRDYSAPSADQVLTDPEINTRTRIFETATSLITMVQASPFWPMRMQAPSATVP